MAETPQSSSGELDNNACIQGPSVTSSSISIIEPTASSIRYINCYFPATKIYRSFPSKFLIYAGIIQNETDAPIIINEDIEIFTSYMHVLSTGYVTDDVLLRMKIAKLAKKYPLASIKKSYKITNEYVDIDGPANQWDTLSGHFCGPLRLYCKQIGTLYAGSWPIQYSIELIDEQYEKVLCRECRRAAALSELSIAIDDIVFYYNLTNALFSYIEFSCFHRIYFPQICLIYDNTYFNIIPLDRLRLLKNFIHNN